MLPRGGGLLVESATERLVKSYFYDGKNPFTIFLRFTCVHACMRVPCNFHVALQGRCSIGVVLPNMSDSSPFFLRAQNFTLVFPIYVCRVYVTCFCVISPLARKT